VVLSQVLWDKSFADLGGIIAIMESVIVSDRGLPTIEELCDSFRQDTIYFDKHSCRVGGIGERFGSPRTDTAFKQIMGQTKYFVQ
jgi:hypothetical protein